MISLEHSLTRVVGVLSTFRQTSWCLLRENKMIKRQYPQATSMIKHGASHNDVIVCTRIRDTTEWGLFRCRCETVFDSKKCQVIFMVILCSTALTSILSVVRYVCEQTCKVICFGPFFFIEMLLIGVAGPDTFSTCRGFYQN